MMFLPRDTLTIQLRPTRTPLKYVTPVTFYFDIETYSCRTSDDKNSLPRINLIRPKEQGNRGDEQ